MKVIVFQFHANLCTSRSFPVPGRRDAIVSCGNGGFIEKNEPSRDRVFLFHVAAIVVRRDVGRSCSAAADFFLKGNSDDEKTEIDDLPTVTFFLPIWCELCTRNVRLIRNICRTSSSLLCKREILIATKLCRADAASSGEV